jgi:hypothetical protein
MAMPFQVIHPRDFPAQFGIGREPNRFTLSRWRRELGFPQSLSVPRGHYRYEEVAEWFESRNKRASKKPAA